MDTKNFLTERVTLKMLRYFYEVTQTKHFSQAAKHLNITNSPLSSQIKELESLLEVRLFTRNSRNVDLTECGEALKIECEQIFKLVDHSLSKVKKIARHQSNTLNVGLVSSAFWAGFGNMLKMFHRRYPNNKVNIIELSPELQKHQLLEKKIDVGISRFADTLNIHPLQYKSITNEAFVVAVSNKHPLKNRKFISISELKDQVFSLLNSRNSASTKMVIDACMQAGFIPLVDNEFIEPHTLMAFVASNHTVTVIPSSFSQHTWEDIHFIRLREMLPASLCLIYDERSISPINKTFIETLSQTFLEKG